MQYYFNKYDERDKKKIEMENEGVTFQPELSKKTLEMFKNNPKSVSLEMSLIYECVE